MPSPFPGMDPWLEGGDLFRDLHHALITYIREAMNAAMPPGYVAISNHLVWMDAEARREPDVSLFGEDRRIGRGRDGLATLPGFVAVGDLTEPVPWEEPYLEIRADNGARLVTAVEVLSPSNKLKNGEGRHAYLEKQKGVSPGRGAFGRNRPAPGRAAHDRRPDRSHPSGGQRAIRLPRRRGHRRPVVSTNCTSPRSGWPTGCRRSASRSTQACRRSRSTCNRSSTGPTTPAGIGNSSGTIGRPIRR